MDMPQLSEAHRKLQRLAGSWTGDETIHPSPWDPQGGPATGRVQNRSVLCGFAVVQDYEQQRGGRTSFEGHGVFRYDTVKRDYVLYWFDSFGMPPNEFRGDFEDDVLTMIARDHQGHSRATFDFGKTDRYTFRMEVSPDAESWSTIVEGSYSRVG